MLIVSINIVSSTDTALQYIRVLLLVLPDITLATRMKRFTCVLIFNYCLITESDESENGLIREIGKKEIGFKVWKLSENNVKRLCNHLQMYGLDKLMMLK